MVPTRIETIPIASRVGDESPNPMSYARPVTSRTISGTRWQVCAFWAYFAGSNSELYRWDKRLIIGKRQLPWGDWTWYPMNGLGDTTSISLTYDGGPNDSHNSIAIDIDADGYIHVAYDTRLGTLKYRRSDSAIGSWTGGVTSVQTMLGTNESNANYPTFFRDPTGALYFTFRDGAAADGDQYIYKYTEGTTSWAALSGSGTGGKVLDGKNTSGAASPYLFGSPQFTSDWDGAGTGLMYVAWTWRMSLGLDNEDIQIAAWDGTSWEDFSGASQTMPITQALSDVVLSVATSEGLFNQSGFCLDANDRPHIPHVKEDGSGYYNLFDLYYNGSSWVDQQITSYASATNNDYLDYGRPYAACDTITNEVFIWWTHTTNETGIVQHKSDAGDFSAWTKTTFLDHDIGNHEPNIDPWIWDEDTKVCMWTHVGNSKNFTGIHSPRLVTRLPKGRSDAFNTSDWSRSHAITIDADQVGTGGVTGYTVVLTRDNFDDELFDPSGSDQAQEDGGDLRFFSDSGLTTGIACQVLSFGRDSSTGAGDAEVEIRVGPLDLSDSVDVTIYVAYGATGKSQPFLDETLGAIAAHDANWALAYPLGKGWGNAIDIEDDVFASLGGTPEEATGKVGNARDFNGAEVIRTKPGPHGISAAMSIAVWIDGDPNPDESQIFTSDAGGTQRGIQFRLDADGKPRFIRFNSSNSVVANFPGTSNLESASWKRLVAEFDTTDGSRILVDATEEATDANTTANHDDSGLIWGIGARVFDASPWASKQGLGLFDQLEVHTTKRGDAWWETDFNNTNSPSTFAAFGTPADIGGATTLVAADVQIPYHVRELAAADHQLPYNLAELVSLDAQLLHAVREAVGSSQTIPFNIRELVAADTQLLSNIRELVSQDTQFLYDIVSLSVVGVSLQVLYQIAENVGADTSLPFNIRETVASDHQLLSDIRELVGANTVVPFNIRALAGTSSELLYNILTSGVVGTSFQLPYNIREQVAADHQLPFNVLVSVAQDVELLYRVLNSVSADVSVPYSIRELAAADVELRYNILTDTILRDLKENGGNYLVRLLQKNTLLQMDKSVH